MRSMMSWEKKQHRAVSRAAKAALRRVDTAALLRMPHSSFAPQAETDAEAACKAADKAEYEIYDDACRADGGKGIGAEGLADDDRIGQRIE